jgi:hypothetical protein
MDKLQAENGLPFSMASRKEIEMSHVDEILDFFESIAMLTNEKALKFEHVYKMFFWPMGCYWVFTEAYIRSIQSEEGNEVWQEYTELMPRLISHSGGAPTRGDATKFFADELERARVS